MRRRLTDELRSLRAALAALDRQTAVVLTLAALLTMAHALWGTQKFFRRTVAPWLDLPGRGLGAELWDSSMQFVVGFLVPVAVLWLGFRRRPAAMGLGRGDHRLALGLAAAYVPLVVTACWLLSALPSFQHKYPGLAGADADWGLLLVYELAVLLYWVGWEYMWRGFVIFGTAHTLGVYAIFVQMIPFALLHVRKPLPEALLSIPGALLLGAVVWRCRAFWIAVPIHWVQMLSMDVWCSLRERTGIDGVGPGALWAVLRSLLG